MAVADHVQTGDTIDFTPGSDLAAGAVVVHGTRVGVTSVAIPSGVPGALNMTGVYDIDCASGTTFAVGAALYWNAGTGKITTTNTDTWAGRAAKAKVSGELKARVRLTDA